MENHVLDLRETFTACVEELDNLQDEIGSAVNDTAAASLHLMQENLISLGKLLGLVIERR